MKFLYHPSAFRFGEPVGSWWEESAGDPVETSDLAADDGQACEVAVIGGGFTGLSAAYHLARDHGTDVRVLEAGKPGWGASGRNGGFCGPGATKMSASTMIRKYGLEQTKAFHAFQREAVAMVAELLEQEDIDAQRVPDGELELAHKPSRIADLKDEQRFLKDTFGTETTFLDRDGLAEHGIAGPEFHAGLLTRGGFGLHPLRYVRGLARAALKHGATVYGEAPVTHWRRDAGEHVLETPRGRLRAKQVIVATNGFTPEDLHGGLKGRLLPALSNILVTRPLTREEQEAQGWTSTMIAFDSRKLLHYVRLLPDGRYLFGGRGGWDASPEGKAKRRAYMERTFRRLYPAWRDVEFTHFWNGFICLTYNLVPHIGHPGGEESVWCGLAYHGSGVAAGSWTGRALARLVAGNQSLGDLPAPMTGPLAKFPFPALRTTYLRGAYATYHFKDQYL